MASEIRVDKINSLSGVGTVTLSPTGVDISGITTVATLKATTGIVTTLTATTGIVTTLTSNTTTLNSTTTATGNINVSGANITLQDSGGSSDDRLVFGAGSDLSIYHDGSNSFLQDSGTGDLLISGDSVSIVNAAASEFKAKFISDGAVELYHNNSKTAYTHGSGFNIKGGNTSDQTELLIYGNEGQDASILLASDDGDDNADYWRMYAQASDNAFTLKNYAAGSYETSIKATGNGNVELYYDNSLRFATTSAGVSVTSSIDVPDNGKLLCGDSDDLQIDHSGTNSQIYHNGTGDLYIATLGSGEDLHLTSTSGKITLNTGGSERLRVIDDGLTFNGDTAAANALDDYEEGSWTPANSDMGVTVHYARYTKIGRMVHIVADVEYASSPADSSQVGYLTGLPFTNGDKSVHQHLPWFGSSAANDNQFFNTYFTPLIFASDDKFSFLNSNSGTYLTRAQLASKKVRINSTYYTSY